MLPLIINLLDFGASEIIEQPPEGIGAELVLPSRKTHYRLTENALHYSLPKRRTHYEVGEET